MESKFYLVATIMQLLGCMDPDVEASDRSDRTVRTSSIEKVADSQAARKPVRRHNDPNSAKQARAHRTFVPKFVGSEKYDPSTKTGYIDPVGQDTALQTKHDRFECLSPKKRNKARAQVTSDQGKKTWSIDSENTTKVGERPTLAQFVAMRKSQSSSPNNVSFRSDTRTTSRATPYTVPGAVSSDSLNTQQEVIAEAEKKEEKKEKVPKINSFSFGNTHERALAAVQQYLKAKCEQ